MKLSTILPRSLSARIIGLTILALLVSQLVGYVSFRHGSDQFVRAVVTRVVGNSMLAARRAADFVQPGQQHALIKALSTRDIRYSLTPKPVGCGRNTERVREYERDFAHKLDTSMQRVRVCFGEHVIKPSTAWSDRAVLVSYQLNDGQWLTARQRLPNQMRHWVRNSLRNLLITALITIIVVIFASRLFTRPLRDLASAAERFGRGESVAPVAERGGDEIKRSIIEFNRMRERLERFVAERTRLVAALAHDLRTPITALRLRLEFLPDDDNTRAMNATLEDMAHMSEAALIFMREEAASERARHVDLGALVDALCEDYRTADRAVVFEPEARVTLVCRPVAIRRALRNIIDNALAYGERATLRLTDTPEAAIIDIEDEGPGIQTAQMDSVFDAFVRLEASRSRETGGAGLGLSIARSAVRGHGGDITLANRPQGGLRVRIRLPRSRA